MLVNSDCTEGLLPSASIPRIFTQTVTFSILTMRIVALVADVALVSLVSLVSLVALVSVVLMPVPMHNQGRGYG